jgi:hypothetical protein
MTGFVLTDVTHRPEASPVPNARERSGPGLTSRPKMATICRNYGAWNRFKENSP